MPSERSGPEADFDYLTAFFRFDVKTSPGPGAGGVNFQSFSRFRIFPIASLQVQTMPEACCQLPNSQCAKYLGPGSGGTLHSHSSTAATRQNGHSGGDYSSQTASPLTQLQVFRTAD
ncbi:hypothetical protein EYF80_011108 [Liparis tanakae]|uniref:Uncharacterized protein n=1 Tax=Liparis tanakae TaxID=230148 RepID=A0A4Z2IMJ6_9TELE|nr:hypothetical protein EYF80_011108 [Liparis tanakae]